MHTLGDLTSRAPDFDYAAIIVWKLILMGFKTISRVGQRAENVSFPEELSVDGIV